MDMWVACRLLNLFSTELNTLNFAFTFAFTSSTYSRVVDFGHYFPPKSTLRLIRESTRMRVYTVFCCCTFVNSVSTAPREKLDVKMSKNKKKKLRKKAKQKQERLEIQLSQLRELEEMRLSCQNVSCPSM